MDIRDGAIFTLAAAVGTVGFAIAIDHAIYLGFSFLYAYPFMLAGALLVVLAYRWAPLNRRLVGLSSPTRSLLLITLAGGLLRVAMAVNANASVDEWKAYLLVSRNAVLNIPWFFANYNTVNFWFSNHPPLAFLFVGAGYLISPTLLGARLFPVFFSILSVPVVYYLAREFSGENVSRLCALLFAINPGVLFFFDAAETDIFLFFFGVTGLLFFARGLRKESFRLILVSGAFFGLTYWSKSTLPHLFLILALVLLLVGRYKLKSWKKVAYIGVAAGLAIGSFTPWYAIDPTGFQTSFVGITGSVVGTLASGSVSLGGSGSVITPPSTSATTGTTLSQTITIKTSAASSSGTQTSTGQTTTNQTTTNQTSTTLPSGFTLRSLMVSLQIALQFPGLIPHFQAGGGTYTSFQDVVAQIPFWFSPLVVLFAIAICLYGFWKGGERGKYFFMLLWILLIMGPLLSVNRDIRYFIDVATFPMVFLAAESVAKNGSKLRRGLEITLVVFAVVFLVVGCFAGYELYSGVSEATAYVDHNLPNASIMTNYGGFYYFLSSHNITDLSYNATQLNKFISSKPYDAAVVWNQARTTSVPPAVLQVLSSHYNHEEVFGLSDFSYVAVYYNSTG